MPITRTDRNQRWADGVLIEEEVVETDITAPSVRFDLHAKARQALDANKAFLAIATPNAAQNAAQAKALTRQVNALIRLVVALDGAVDLLAENTDT